MKTTVNDLQVYNFKPAVTSSMLPRQVTDDNGMPNIIHVEVANDSFPSLPYSLCQLQAQLSAGVDPAKSRIDTSNYNRINNVSSALNDLPMVDNLFDSPKTLDTTPIDNN